MDLRQKLILLFAGAGLLVTGGLVLAPREAAIADPRLEAQRRPGNTEDAAPTRDDIRKILSQGETSAQGTVSDLRAVAGAPQPTRMHIAVVARNGRFLDIRSQDDAWVGSIDIAIAKARTAAFFSSNQNALTSKALGELTQAHDAHVGVPRDGTGPAGPLWGIGNSNQIGISGSQEFRNGIITFAGGIPLYKNGVLIGGVGVSGDSVQKDQVVALAAAAGFAPPANIPALGFGSDFDF